MTFVLILTDRLYGGVAGVLARSPSELGTVTPSEVSIGEIF